MKNVEFFIVFWPLFFEFWRGCVFFFLGGGKGGGMVWA